MSNRGLLAFLILAGGCGGAGGMTIVEARDVHGSNDSPSISRVVDIGDIGALPAVGQALPPADTDGVYGVGEFVLIEGEDFGRQPTVNIGGRPASALARTGTGAILARIPPGVPTGAVEVEVSHPGGKGKKTIEVRRHAVVVGGGAVHVLQLVGDGTLKPAGKLEIAGARDAAVSSDGSTVYVAADAAGAEKRARLVVISLVAGGGPRQVRSLPLPGSRASHVVTADTARLGVVLGGGKLLPFDTSTAKQPALYQAVSFGGEPLAAALHPEGRTLALLSADNRLQLIEVARPDAVKVGDPVDLAPGERMPLGCDLGWSPAGDELWVLLGDGAVSLKVGPHPARLLTVAADGAPAVRGQAEVAGVDSPLALAVARRESIQAATAIRTEARKAVLVVASVERSLVMPDQIETALAQPHPFGALVRTDLEGKGQAIWTGEEVVGDVELTQDVAHAVAAGARAVRGGSGVTWELDAQVVPLEGGEGKRLALGPMKVGEWIGVRVAVSP